MVNVSIDERRTQRRLTRSLKVGDGGPSERPRPELRTPATGGLRCGRIRHTADRFLRRRTRGESSVTVSLENDQTGQAAATATVSGLAEEWKQYTYTLKTGEVAASATII